MWMQMSREKRSQMQSVKNLFRVIISPVACLLQDFKWSVYPLCQGAWARLKSYVCNRIAVGFLIPLQTE